MSSAFTLDGDMISNNRLDQIMRDTIGTHYMIAGALLVLLGIVVVYLYWKKEKFMPIARNQIVSLSGAEAMDQPTRASSVFAQTTQGDPLAPGDCSNVGQPVDDAWGYLNAVAHESTSEGLSNKKDKTDAHLSSILGGH